MPSWVPYYLSRAKRHLKKRVSKLSRAGFRIHLGVDLEHQRLAQKALWNGAHSLGERQGYTGVLGHVDDRRHAGVDAILKAYNGPKTTWQRDRLYPVLVRSVERDSVSVSAGYDAFSLSRKSLAWTKPYALDSTNNRGVAVPLRQTFSRGDIVLVRLTKDGDVALAQIPPVEGAFIAVDNYTRQLTAAVGGIDYTLSQFDRSEQACRSPGSTFKPIVYAEALERGLTLASVFDDTPLTIFDRQKNRFWKPRNPNGRYLGPMTMIEAIRRSANIPVIRALRQVGSESVALLAKRLGVDEEMYPDDGLALGASCLTAQSLLRVYSTLALGGSNRALSTIERVIDRHGQTRFDQTSPLAQVAPPRFRIDGLVRLAVSETEQSLSPTTGYLMQQALHRVVRSGTGRRAKFGHLPLAGKTGTTDKFDAWFAGFSHQFTAISWIGADNNERALGTGDAPVGKEAA